MKRPTWQQIHEFTANRPSLGKKIRENREAKKLTILKIAKQAGVGAQFWSNLEHDRVWPPENMFSFMAELFGTTPALFGQEVDRYDHDIRKYLTEHREVVDWLRRASKHGSERPLILR